MFIRWLFDLPFSEERLLLYSYLVTNIVAIYFIYKRKMKHILFIVLASWLCIGATIMVDYAFDKLQPHQKARINNLLGIETDLTGAGYNVNQSKIAIGSGGFFGKGYLQGTQTKYNFVPEQSTDFFSAPSAKNGALSEAPLLYCYSWLLYYGLSTWPSVNAPIFPGSTDMLLRVFSFFMWPLTSV